MHAIGTVLIYTVRLCSTGAAVVYTQLVSFNKNTIDFDRVSPTYYIPLLHILGTSVVKSVRRFSAASQPPCPLYTGLNRMLP